MRTIQWKKLLPGAAAVLVLGGLILGFARRANGAEPPAQVLSAQVTAGQLETTLAAGGSLAVTEREELRLPSGVEVERILVRSGEQVTQGQPLALVDSVSVMSAIVSVQDSLDKLSQKITQAASLGSSQTLYASCQGWVKAVYVSPGDQVRQVMLEHGCLALLSLDGLMAVDLESAAPLRAGDRVTVRCDGVEYSGRVASALQGEAVITLTDEGPALGAAAEVCSPEGELLGSGSLRVHSPLKLMAVDGTVSTVNLRQEAMIWQTSAMMTLKNTSGAELTRLSAQHRDYEEKLQELFAIYRSGSIDAPRDGVVSDIQKDLAKNTAAAGGGKIRLLAEEEESAFRYELVAVSSLDSEGKPLGRSMEWPLAIDDLSALTAMIPTAVKLLGEGEEKPVSLSGALAMDGSAHDTPEAGDLYVRIYEGEELSRTLYLGNYQELLDATAPDTESQEPAVPGLDGVDLEGLDLSGLDLSGLMGSLDLSGLALPTDGQQAQEQLYDLEGSPLMSISSAETMELHMAVDELDVLRYSPGMSAQIRVDALPEQLFSGTVTEIAAQGSNAGGNSKFDVTVSLPRAPGMLEGMNASVIISCGDSASVLTLPVAALQDKGSGSFVYLSYDAKTRTLGTPVPVTTGRSDGTLVEILSGLEEGDAVWYEYSE